MQRSIYLAKLIGPVLLAIGAGLLLNGPVFRVMAGQFLASYAMIFLAGLLTLAAGIALVLAHNVWEASWRLIITVLGWLGVIGGAFRIIVPQEVAAIGSKIISHPQIPMFAGFVVIVLGAVLSYYGYGDAISATKSRASARKRSRRS